MHERSVDSDLLLLLLKGLLRRRGASAPTIVLMSATADAELFASYFSNAGNVSLWLSFLVSKEYNTMGSSEVV